MSGKKIKNFGVAFRMLFIPAFIILMVSGCQKDDICSAATQTTPMMLISFFNVDDTLPKPATNLIVREIFHDTVVISRGNAAEIRIPLRVDSGTTEYQFILNAPTGGAQDTSQTSRIIFSYDPEEIYINRACSFKVNFMDLEAEIIATENPWIESITVVEENIENETSAHIHIFH